MWIPKNLQNSKNVLIYSLYTEARNNIKMRFPNVAQITRPKTFFWILENIFEIIDFLFTSSVMYQIFLYDLFILFYFYYAISFFICQNFYYFIFFYSKL